MSGDQIKEMELDDARGATLDTTADELASLYELLISTSRWQPDDPHAVTIRVDNRAMMSGLNDLRIAIDNLRYWHRGGVERAGVTIQDGDDPYGYKRMVSWMKGEL